VVVGGVVVVGQDDQQGGLHDVVAAHVLPRVQRLAPVRRARLALRYGSSKRARPSAFGVDRDAAAVVEDRELADGEAEVTRVGRGLPGWREVTEGT